MNKLTETHNDYFAHSSAIVDDGADIGGGTKIWHFSHVMSGAKIGENCSLGQNVYVASDVVIGNGAKIQNNVSLYDGITLGEDVFCGPSMVFTNVKTPRCSYPRREEYSRTVVKAGASIGANATIVCGITIGAWAFIAAGAVITRDVAPYSLMAGVPARRIGWVSEAGHTLSFDDENIAVCPETNQKYQRRNDLVVRQS